MRIENAINEIRGPEALERRDAEVKRRRQSARTGDTVEISNAARSLGSQAVKRSDLDSVSDVRQTRVDAVKQRVASGFYDRPEVREAIADAVLNSGVVDQVGQEAQQVNAAREELANAPEVREDRVAQARERVAAAFYDSSGVLAETADRLLDSFVG